MQEEIDADVCRHAEQALWAAVIHRVWADYFDSGCQACRAAWSLGRGRIIPVLSKR